MRKYWNQCVIKEKIRWKNFASAPFFLENKNQGFDFFSCGLWKSCINIWFLCKHSQRPKYIISKARNRKQNWISHGFSDRW